jgi:glucose/mannose-6-phosphate isomerase
VNERDRRVRPAKRHDRTSFGLTREPPCDARAYRGLVPRQRGDARAYLSLRRGPKTRPVCRAPAADAWNLSTMRSLDDRVASGRAADPSGMLEIVRSLPRQLREGWRAGRAADLRPLHARPAHVVFAGLGGSAIGGDLLAAALGPALAVPLVVVRDSVLPTYIGAPSLVIASSYSGETDEVLEAAESAVTRGARLLAVTSGGRLAALAESRGQTVVRVPGGLPPRAALGYLLGPVLGALERWEVCPPCAADVEEAAQVMDALGGRMGPDVPEERNAAKRLAARLAGRIPVVYAASPDAEPAARRWKSQFNENSKTIAVWNVFPELAHNEVVGWAAPAEIARLLEVVVLFTGMESERTRRLVAAACEAVPRAADGVPEIAGCGESRLARLLSLVLIGDLTSVYLAYLRGVDPTPIEAITALKQRMRGL